MLASRHECRPRDLRFKVCSLVQARDEKRARPLLSCVQGGTWPCPMDTVPQDFREHQFCLRAFQSLPPSTLLLLGLGSEPWGEAASWALHVLSCTGCLVDIQVMMGSLVYLRLGLENSPYCHLLDNSHWAEICETFTRDACSLLGLSVESPLSVRYSSPVHRAA